MILSLVLSMVACGEAEEATAESTAEAVDECATIVWTPVCNCGVTVDLRGLAPELEDFEGAFEVSFALVGESTDVAHAALCPLDLGGLRAAVGTAAVDSVGTAFLDLSGMETGSAWVSVTHRHDGGVCERRGPRGAETRPLILSYHLDMITYVQGSARPPTGHAAPPERR